MSTAEFHYALGEHLRNVRPGCEEYSVVASAAKCGVPIYTSSPGDSSIGMNVAFHELMHGGTLMIDPNKDVNEVCAIILAGEKNGCVILGGGSPKNFYLQGQPTLWEVYGIPKGGNDYFIQITTDQVVWGGLSGATASEAVSWGKVNPGVLPDTVVPTSIPPSRFRSSVSTPVATRMDAASARVWCTSARRWSRRSKPKPSKRGRRRPSRRQRRKRKAVLTRS